MSRPFALRTCRPALFLALALAAAPASALAGGDGDLADDIRAIWNDPVFQKQFVGGYGINAEIEPRLPPEEAAILEKVRPLMADNLPKAEETLRKQMKADCSATLDFQLATIQFQQERYDESLVNYNKAVAKFPSFRRAWRNLGLIHVKQAGSKEGREAQDEYDAAIRAFTRMIELGGADAYSYGLLGFAYTAKQDFLPAEASYRNALLLQPENTEWRLGLTRCVFKQQKYEEAVALLDVLVERYPEKPEFWQLQAQAFLGLKQPLRAAQNLEIVDRLGKATPDNLHTLGDIYVTENLLDLAQGAYRPALERDPSQPAAKTLRDVELLAARGGSAQARQLGARVQEVLGPRLEDADRRRLLKLEARLDMAEGGGTAETARVLEEIVRIDPLDG